MVLVVPFMLFGFFDQGNSATVKMEDDPLFPCGDTRYCEYREKCNDTKAILPPKCRRNSKIVQCIDACRDPKELLDCFNQRSLNDTEEYCVLKYQRKLDYYDPLYTVHPGLPCTLKCLVDPEFWTCVHKCDGRGCLKSIRYCQEVRASNGTKPPPCNDKNDTDSSVNGTCYKCYSEQLRKELKLSPECIVRYVG